MTVANAIVKVSGTAFDTDVVKDYGAGRSHTSNVQSQVALRIVSVKAESRSVGFEREEDNG